jgi:hypothetical protein
MQTFTRLICRILALSMMLLPFHSYAGLVGTDSAAAQAQRVLVRDFVARADVAAKLQALGVAPAQAQNRVDALTDAEIASLATRIENLPAGADPATIGILLVIALVIWRLWVDAQEKEAAASKRTTTAPAKPAPKPEAK